MLASITPLGERGRHSTWGVTVTAFALAASAAGAALGLMMGALGELALPGSVGERARLSAFAALAAVALALDVAGLRRGRVPGPRRQVDHGWIDSFRGWVYGGGFGAQLGLGVTTVVTSAATYLAVAAAVLTRAPFTGAAVLGVHGALRGLTPLLAVGVDRPVRLMALHSHLRSLQAPVACGSLALLGGIFLLALGGAL